MQLSPLQSRLAASLCASFFLFAIYLLLFSPNFALAVEVAGSLHVTLDEPLDIRSTPYEPEFAGTDKGIVGTLTSNTVALLNNVAITLSLQPGTSAKLLFTGNSASGDQTSPEDDDADQSYDAQFLRKREADKQVFVSANMCRHPQSETDEEDAPEVAQLRMYLSSTSMSPQSDGQLSSGDVLALDFEEGSVLHALQSTGNVYITIVAPKNPDSLEGVYTVEVAASSQSWYHGPNPDPSELELVASDSGAALLMTTSPELLELGDDWQETEESIKDDPPYVMFAERVGSNRLNGVRRSYCGLQQYADIAAVEYGVLPNVAMRLSGPSQHFHIQGLAADSAYSFILVHTGRKFLGKREPGQVGGGGQVFQPRKVQTTLGDNCKVVSNLKFCTDVNYAVPANPDKFNTSQALGQFYDDYARGMYKWFNNSMAQISCEATDDAMYSLARNCNDCENAYKRWLCAVAIPRCEDYTSSNPFTQLRNLAQPFPNGSRIESADSDKADPATQSSRNTAIDENIAPGPYREVLPCADVCFQLVQSCPAALGFSCPQPGMLGFEKSYGRKQDDDQYDSCNAPGMTVAVSRSSHVSVYQAGVLLVLCLSASSLI